MKLVERMLDLHKKKSALPVSSERERVELRTERDAMRNARGNMQRSVRSELEIAATDERIDDIMYRLYGITGEERKIIESGGGRV